MPAISAFTCARDPHLAEASNDVHAKRLAAVVDVVEAMTFAKHLTLTSIGRAMRGRTSARHNIKKADRLLGNWRLHREVVLFYRTLARRLVRANTRAIVLIDWTQIHGDYWALTASVPFLGRSIPILSRTHLAHEIGARTAHAAFLADLKKVLPEGSKPVLVADGGFRSPFFNACEDAQFHYVIRLRNDRALARFGLYKGAEDYEEPRFGELFERATEKAQCLGIGRPYARSRNSINVRMVLGPRPPKADRKKKYADDYERKRACEPVLIATNLENDAAESIVRIYAARMQIEETFRDTKSPRFGWGLDYTKTRSTRRFDVLLMLAALATAAVALIGAAARELGHESKYRARSGKAVVLSVFTLGTLIAAAPRRLAMRFSTVWRQWKKARLINREFLPDIPPPKSERRLVRFPLSHDLFCADHGWNGAVWGWPP